jgi:PAS domain S-box-containing protein
LEKLDRKRRSGPAAGNLAVNSSKSSNGRRGAVWTGGIMPHSETPIADPQDRHKTILLVEDEGVTAMAEKRVLQKYGFLVLTAPSGEKAIEAVKSNEQIDLILMDINLGEGLDGTEAAEIILSERDIPVIFLSNYTQGDVVEKTDRVASYGYVVKNSGEAVLIASVNMAFRLQETNRELKNREEALKASEKRFRSLFETSKDSILLIDQETRRILGANPAACKLYGYSPEEFVSLKITDVSAEPEKTEAAVRQSVPEVTFRLHRRKDGTVFPVEISGSFFTEGTRRLNTAFIRDITDRKKAEEQLLIANFGIQSSNSAIRFADLDGRIISVNDSFVRLWGYERVDEVLGRHISEFAMAGMEGEGIKALLSGRGSIGEGEAKKKDGSSFYVQVTASVVKTDEGSRSARWPRSSTLPSARKPRRLSGKAKNATARFLKAALTALCSPGPTVLISLPTDGHARCLG